MTMKSKDQVDVELHAAADPGLALLAPAAERARYPFPAGDR